MVVIDAYSSSGQLLYGWLKRLAEDAPNIFYISFKETIPKKYELKANITKKNMIDFYHQIVEGKVKPILHSGKVPEDNSGLIKTVVRDNWDQIVGDPKTNVLMMYFSNTCRHCAEFKKVYLKIAQKYALSTEKNLVFAELNINENDVDTLVIKMVPALYFYRAGDKLNPIEFVYKPTHENVETFIETSLEEVKKKKKKKSKSDKKKEEL
jgi:thioredoxin-like negative regulator of GroEL